MPPHWTSIAFTGHRRIDNPEVVARGLGEAVDRVVRRYGPAIGLTSAASGADTLFLRLMQQRGLPCFVCLPFSVERFRQDFAPEQWDQTWPLIESAAGVRVIQNPENDTEAYLEAGLSCIDDATVLIAVWDGEPARGPGGTGDVVEYARLLGKPMILLDPSTGALCEENTDVIVPANDQQLLKAVELAETPPKGWRAVVEREYNALDEDAICHAPRSRQLLLIIIMLHLIATAAAVTAAVVKLPEALDMIASLIKLGGLVLALGLAFRHHKRHQHWIASRAKAEFYRAFLAVWPMRRANGCPIDNPPPGMKTIFESLRVQWYLDSQAEQDLKSAKQGYLSGRIEEQLAYYRSRHLQARRAHTLFSRVAHSSTFIAVLLAALALILHLNHNHSAVYGGAKLFSILLPLFSAATLSMVVGQDLSRRARRYGEITASLESIQARISHAETWPGLYRLVWQTERILLQELAEWRAMTQYAGEAH